MNCSRCVTASILLVFTGCGDSAGTGPGGRGPVTLSFRTQPQAASLARSASLRPSAPSLLTVTDAANELVVSRAQLVLSELEFKRTAADECDDSDEGKDGECEEFELGPVLVDLPVTAGLSAAVTAQIPTGSYRKMEAKIDAITFDDDDDDDDHGDRGCDHDHDTHDFLAAHPEFAGVSVRLEGTFNGQPFVYTSGVEAELEFHFAEPLVVENEGVNVTIAVELSRWFIDRAGNLINPGTAGAGGPNAERVNANIRVSFDGFEDDDHDGDDDSRDGDDDGRGGDDDADDDSDDSR